MATKSLEVKTNTTDTNDKPARDVSITKGFRIGQREVTVAAYTGVHRGDC